jgi:ribosomal protein L21E
MKRILNVGLVLAGLMTASVMGFGQKPAVVADSKPGWHRIAGLEADFSKGNESVHIMGNDEFKALRFRVEDAPIHIERMQVFYESGDMEDIDVKSAMAAGETSKVFQLKHEGRDIAKIAFTYQTVGNDKSKKAELEIYGLKTNETAADTDKKVEKTENDIEQAAEKTGDAVSEAAAKTAAEIDDKKLDTKVGPDGQAIYIGDDDRYYYINDEGKRVFVTEVQLKDKG